MNVISFPLIVYPTTDEELKALAASLVTGKVVHCKQHEDCVLIDRTTKWGNRYWEFLPKDHQFPKLPDGKFDVPHDEKVKAYGRQIQHEMALGNITYWDLYDLRDKNLGCWCKDDRKPANEQKSCHGDIIRHAVVFAVGEMIKAQWINHLGQEMVSQFDGTYRFLSNMFPCQPFVDEHGIEHRYSETYYMAEKTDDIEMKKVLAKMNGYEAKKHARAFGIEKPGWRGSQEQIDAMGRALRYKYRDPNLRAQLIATHPMYLREGNNHHDRFFGHCLKTGAGCNVLGLMLMWERDLCMKEEAAAKSLQYHTIGT